jgi:hypothetical protein
VVGAQEQLETVVAVLEVDAQGVDVLRFPKRFAVEYFLEKASDWHENRSKPEA